MDKQQEKSKLSEKRNSIFRESYVLAKKSFSLVRKDPHVILFPILSASLIVFFLTAVFVLRFLFLSEGRISLSLSLFLGFIVVFFSTFSKIGATLCFRSHITGAPILVRDAFRKTAKKIDLIFAWSMISSFVGVILLILPSDIYTALIAILFGAYWSLSTYFIMPAFSENGAIFSQSFARSVDALKKSWKEMILINLGFEFLFAFIFVFFVAIFGDLLFLFPLFLAVTPFFAGVSALVMAFLIFILAFLTIIGMLFRVSLNLVLYMLVPEHQTGKIETIKKTIRKTIKKLIVDPIELL
jgi:hypothetical protein